MEKEQLKQRTNTGLVSLDIVARMNRIDVDMRAIIREYGIETTDLSSEELMRIAKTLALRLSVKTLV